jgi:hypothetical protein
MSASDRAHPPVNTVTSSARCVGLDDDVTSGAKPKGEIEEDEDFPNCATKRSAISAVLLLWAAAMVCTAATPSALPCARGE